MPKATQTAADKSSKAKTPAKKKAPAKKKVADKPAPDKSAVGKDKNGSDRTSRKSALLRALRKGPATRIECASRTGSDSYTGSTMRLLEAQGFVKCERSEDRKITYSLTTVGKKRAEKCEREHKANSK